jgi:hypothetical protein
MCIYIRDPLEIWKPQKVIHNIPTLPVVATFSPWPAHQKRLQERSSILFAIKRTHLLGWVLMVCFAHIFVQHVGLVFFLFSASSRLPVVASSKRVQFARFARSLVKRRCPILWDCFGGCLRVLPVFAAQTFLRFFWLGRLCCVVEVCDAEKWWRSWCEDYGVG